MKSTSIVLPNRPADRNGGNRTVSFEGTPVADARNVYVAVTDRREQTATYIACLDADTGAQPLDPLPGVGVAGWRQLFWHADAVRRYDRVE